MTITEQARLRNFSALPGRPIHTYPSGTVNGTMTRQPDTLDVAALAASKQSEREQIADDLRAGEKSAEQIAAEHQPFAQLGRRAVIRFDLAPRLS